jgi:hypothetical protein
VNLGAAGLSPEVRLWHYTDAGATWTAADASAVTVTDLGTGEYEVDSLPTASGSDRYRAVVYLPGDPELELAGLTSGALPGSQVLWVPRIDAPEPNRFYASDSSGTIRLGIASGLPVAITDPGTVVTFTLVSEVGGAPLLDHVAAVVASYALDATTTTYSATLAHALEPGELAGLAGRYLGFFTVTFAGAGGSRTFPSPNAPALLVTVATAPGGGP